MKPTEVKKTEISFEKLDNLQNNIGASVNQMKKIANFMSCSARKKSIPSHYSKHLSEHCKSLSDIYNEQWLEFDAEGDKKEIRPVVWADAETLLDAVIDKRNLCGYYVIKLMADGGQGFFKISMTILPENYAVDEAGKKRSLYCEGGSVGKEAKLTSVERLIILCVVPKIKETYENLDLLFTLTKVNNIPFKFIADFKLILIINGQQTASATNPCPYCFITLKNLKNYRDGMQEVSNQMKTYGDLKRNYQSFCNKGKKKKDAKYCNSTVNSPLLKEDDDLTVIEKCLPPELHLLQGFLNHLFWDGLVPIFGRENALIWPRKLGLISKNYHGEVFEGNACRELLKNASKLKDKEICQEDEKLEPFVYAFETMDKIVKACFGVQRDESADIDQLIKELEEAVLSTGVSITLKIHVILAHIKQSLQLFDNDIGLGLWSEQPGESIHHVFYKYWLKYKVNSMENPSYAKRLKSAVVEFSSMHI